MTELTITLTGEVRESTFEEWNDGLIRRIHSVDASLSKDDEFTSAPRTKADQVFTRVRERWRADRAVDNIDLIGMD